MTATPAILDALNAAKIDATVWRTARRMLDHAGSNGLCRFTREYMLTLCGTNSDNSVRRHLNDLHVAGLIDYSLGEYVYVAFPALLPSPFIQYPPPAKLPLPATEPAIFYRRPLGRAPGKLRVVSRTARAGDHTARAGDHVAREDDHPARDAARSPHTRAGWVGGISPNPSQSCQLSPTTHPPKLASASVQADTAAQADAGPGQPGTANLVTAAPDTAEHDRSYALLTDPEVGVTAFRAHLLASQHAFPALLAQVCNFRRDLNHGTVHSAGALVRRIENGYGATIADEDRDTALWRRHVTPADEAAWNARDEAEQRHRKYDMSRFG